MLAMAPTVVTQLENIHSGAALLNVSNALPSLSSWEQKLDQFLSNVFVHSFIYFLKEELRIYYVCRTATRPDKEP